MLDVRAVLQLQLQLQLQLPLACDSMRCDAIAMSGASHRIAAVRTPGVSESSRSSGCTQCITSAELYSNCVCMCACSSDRTRECSAQCSSTATRALRASSRATATGCASHTLSHSHYCTVLSELVHKHVERRGAPSGVPRVSPPPPPPPPSAAAAAAMPCDATRDLSGVAGRGARDLRALALHQLSCQHCRSAAAPPDAMRCDVRLT